MHRFAFLLAKPADIHLRIPSELDEKDKARRDAVVRALVGLIVSVIILLLLGVVMVFSATSAETISDVWANSADNKLFSVATNQLIIMAASLVICVIIAALPYRLIERLSYWALVLGLGLQAAVLFVGEEINGNTNWLVIGPVSIQPSELLKAAMIVWLAHMLARLSNEEVKHLHALVMPAVGLALAVGLVLLGKDMGTALIYILIAGGMLWLAGMRNMYVVAVCGVGAFAAALLVAVEPSRLRRISDFTSGFFSIPDTIDITQIEFAQFAFGSGGLAGVGLGASKEKWSDLAEAHTDFIFAIIGEELGLLGSLTVVFLFLMLGWSFVQLAVNMNTRYGQLVTIGAGLWICGQGFANMCVVVGLLPVFGVPLPFLSQGGSSMLGVLIIVGVVVGCALRVPGVWDAFSWRSPSVRQSKALVKGASQ